MQWTSKRALLTWASIFSAAAVSAQSDRPTPDRASSPAVAFAPTSLGALDLWDDGLAELSFFDATDVIYGGQRRYIRVHIVNRQWLGRSSGVKAAQDDPDGVAVFKLNVAEEIPTENYNYRLLTTLFLTRADLAPLKMVASNQEWCGTTFKHLRWRPGALSVRSFSYFGDEGDKEWKFEGDAVPYEALWLIARDVAAAGRPRCLNVLASFRSAHQVEPKSRVALLEPGPIQTITVPVGRFEGRRISVLWGGQQTSFAVEAAAPYRLLSYQMGKQSGELKFTERRAYWDRTSKSGFYDPGKAP